MGFATEDGQNFLRYDSSTRTTGGRVDLERLLAPVVPGKIVAVGLNYRDHAREMAHEIPKEPVLFIKPSTAVIGPGEAIRYPSQSSRVDYEAELAVVIGRTCKDAPAASARDFILGYTCLLYTSDAADDLLCVDLGGRRIIKKNTTENKRD